MEHLLSGIIVLPGLPHNTYSIGAFISWELISILSSLLTREVSYFQEFVMPVFICALLEKLYFRRLYISHISMCLAWFPNSDSSTSICLLHTE